MDAAGIKGRGEWKVAPAWRRAAEGWGFRHHHFKRCPLRLADRHAQASLYTSNRFSAKSKASRKWLAL